MISKKLKLGNFPTKIERLEKLSTMLKENIYIKRDDQTGSEVSGNKIRKLEFSINEAINNDCDTLITCGGIQSNHARATAAAGIKLGLKSVLVLRSDETPEMEGNYLIDKIMGADIRIISSEDYRERRQEIMENILKELEEKGRKGYIIPEGASNGIGTFGYINCFKEILDQEKKLGITFDTIVTAVGSGGTFAGLYLGNKLTESNKKIVGINVCDSAEYFKDKVCSILEEVKTYIPDRKFEITKDDMHIIDGYVGDGYALSRPEELEFICDFAEAEGIILDPVYTGKTMRGLYTELKKGTFKDSKNILFIHTGGIFGLFSKRNQFGF
ncbi:D-cysteine desulfhydrase family protein [Fusobacterium perfoetens]|uniref:D-cysteine desulfhydrase family protein n=1 Tax=Fusobacterium perfoetens TaxID=852 RepID=UPI001F16FC18|nr:D-cysteine desulfhydrase family protein [Fusobacterium perfoetens]